MDRAVTDRIRLFSGAERQGRLLGLIGKEGGSGGWTHLHFEIKARQPSGKWGTEEGYAFLWQSYVQQHQPKLIAVARPSYVAFTLFGIWWIIP